MAVLAPFFRGWCWQCGSDVVEMKLASHVRNALAEFLAQALLKESRLLTPTLNDR
jgi:hypothetical protein